MKSWEREIASGWTRQICMFMVRVSMLKEKDNSSQ